MGRLKQWVDRQEVEWLMGEWIGGRGCSVGGRGSSGPFPGCGYWRCVLIPMLPLCCSSTVHTGGTQKTCHTLAGLRLDATRAQGSPSKAQREEQACLSEVRGEAGAIPIPVSQASVLGLTLNSWSQ